MRKIIILLLVLMTFGANAQRIQKINNYGYAYNRLGADTLFYLPSDTFSVPAFYQSYPFMAKKGSNLYLWNTSTFIWELLSGSGSTYTFQYPLSETAGVAKIDTNFFWKPYGNSAINPLLNFLGTTDSNSLVFKVNNFHSGLISYATISPVNGQPASKGTHFGFGAGAYSASLGLESGTYFGNGTGMYAGDSTSANTFIGNKAGLFHSVGGTFGGRNVAIGEYSQYSSVRGYDNTSVGVFALNQNFSGFGNSAFGRDALKSSLDGNGNSAFGAYSLWHNTSGVVGANIANGGSGYTTATVTLPAPTYPSTGGTCFEQATATAIISGGSIVGITITNPGCGYITSSYGMNKLGFAYTWAVDSNIVITGDGTGAAATVIFGSGEGNSAYGVYSGTYRRLSYYDTYIGYQSGHNSRYRDSLNLFIGYSTDVDTSIPLTTNIIKSTAIGYNAKVGASNTLILGGTGASQPSVGIGTITPNPLRFLDVRSDIDVNGLRLGRGQGNINSNAIFGFESGYSLTSGIANTGVGYRTLKLNTTGGYNTAFGWNSLVNNQTATLNTAVGVQAFINLVSSAANTAIGSNSFYTYTGTGVTNGWNVGVGNYSGFYTTIGHSNTFIGSYAGSSNQTGYNNIALGIAAFGGGFYPSPGILTSSANDMIAVGTLSLQNAAQGGYSIGIGFEALRGSNGATGKNIAIGYQAGKAITTGNYNVVIGGNDGTTIATKSNHVIISDGQGNIKSVTDSLGNIVFSGTGAMTIHIGTTAQRPSSPTAGMYRFNSDSLAPEFYSGSAWEKVGTGGGGITNADNGLVKNSSGFVGLDSNGVNPLTRDVLIDADGNRFEISNTLQGIFKAGSGSTFSLLDVGVGSAAIGSYKGSDYADITTYSAPSKPYIELNVNSSTDGYIQQISLDSNDIVIRPHLGNLKIDTLNSTTDTTGKSLVIRNLTTGLLENIDPALIGGGGSGGITVGTTTITSGTNGRIGYNNSGVYGEKAVTGTGDVVLATSPALVTPNIGVASGTSVTLSGLTTRRVLYNNDGLIKDTSTFKFNEQGELQVGNATRFGTTYSVQATGGYSSATGRFQGQGTDGISYLSLTQTSGSALVYNGHSLTIGNGSATMLMSSIGIQLWNGTRSIITKKLFVGANTEPTANLHIAAGTATANTAPIKFTSGTNLTTAEAGAMEYDGTNLFFTPSSATRNNILMTASVNSVSPTSPDRTITVVINGTTYYIAAKTTND